MISGVEKTKTEDVEEICRMLAEIGRGFYARQWVLGTSGNFSAVTNRNPLILAISASGIDKSALSQEQILLIDENAQVISENQGHPSAESLLHVRIVQQLGAGAVLHTHSVWSTVLSEVHSAEGGIAIEGFEMLKGLSGVNTHEHTEWLPIVENSQDMSGLAETVSKVLHGQPEAHGFLVRRHGLYTWGKDLIEAKRHVEILEFLLQATGYTSSFQQRKN